LYCDIKGRTQIEGICEWSAMEGQERGEIMGDWRAAAVW